MDQWFASLTAWLALHPQWLGLAILSIACVECLAIAGILVPGTLLLFAAATIAGNGALGLWQTLALAYCGGLLGDALSYAMGRYFQRDIHRLPGLRSHPQWLSTAQRCFARYGATSLLLGRYIGPLRPMLPMVAGMLNMPLARFSLISMLAAAGWSIAYLLPGWVAGAALRLPLPPGFWPQATIVAAALTLVLLLAARSCLREQPQASLITAGGCMLLLLALIFGWPYLNALDQGLMTLIQQQRSSSLDHLALLITHFGDLTVQLAVALLLCLLLLLGRHWQALLLSSSTLLGTALSNALLKMLFARGRPEILSEPLSTYSFPSGHSSAAFAFFLVWAVLLGRGLPARLRLTWLLLAGLPACSIALSRVYLGVHWPSDIIAGALLAGCWCAISLTLIQRFASLPALPSRHWRLIAPTCLSLLIGLALWQLTPNLGNYSY